jgi:hypothetical protein
MEQLPTAVELLTRQFYEWERHGRGWTVWPGPVGIEPPFRPFTGHFVPRRSVQDDGQFETNLSRFGASLVSRLLGKKQEPVQLPPVEELEEPEPEFSHDRNALIELQTLLPAKLDISREAFEQFLLSLSLCREPVVFELLGLHSHIGAQFVAHRRDSPLIQQQLEAYFPEAVFLQQEGTLEAAWNYSETAIVEFGLGKEFMLRLASGKLDPFVGIIGALTGLEANELGLFQIIFRRAQHPWGESILRAVMDNNGDAFFSNAPELVGEARKKVSRPLYAAVVRIATQSEEFDRTWELARNMAGALNAFADPVGNELIPLTNDDYSFESHVEDVLRRQSRRSGMILNSEELIGFVHLPGVVVRSPKLLRETKKTKAVPDKLSSRDGILLGRNVHQGRVADVRITPSDRVRHMHVVGASGTGKTTLLLNCIRQDIENGAGIGVLDPHGDLVDDILAIIPPERIDDVVLVDPSDEEYSVGFNILLAHSDLEKTLLASDLVSIFQRLSTSWGDQMGSVLQNSILAFLESSVGGTLSDMRRFLVDPVYRAEFLKTVGDPDVVFYWKKTFPQLTGNRSIGPVLTRLETFLSPKSIRYMVSQPVNRLDFADILDSGKIFLAKLSQGQIGRENAFLLGSLLVAKFQQTAMSRQRMAAEARRDFWLYIDEFHNFISPSMAEILTGARKYRLGLTLAHQELRQLQRDSEVAGAVMSNTYTRIVFRVGDEDARKLGDGFGYFEATDLQNLGTGEAIARVERSDFDFNLSVPLLERPSPEEAAETRARIVTVSRKKYGTPRTEIEARLRSQSPEMPEEPTSRVQTSQVKSEPANIPKNPEPTQPPTPSKPLPAPVIAPTATTPSPPPIATDLGRGGAQHKSIQERLQTEAHTLGFLASVESQLTDKSNHAADLTLRKGKLALAIEIAVTTTTDHEFGNVKKCLAAGFSRVAVVSPKAERLKTIADAVQAGLGSMEAAKVSYHTPDDLISELRKLVQEDSQAADSNPKERVTRGYKVRRHGPALTPEERKSKEDVAIKLMAEAMKKKP